MNERHFLWPVLILVSLGALVVVAGLSWWRALLPPWLEPAALELPAQAPAPSLPPAATAQPVRQTAQVYWLASDGSPVSKPLKVKAKSDQVTLAQALETLLQGPTDPNLTSAIPQGTRLLNLQVKGDNIYLDLSSDFERGGGSASMLGRMTQVVYTATSVQPKANLWLSVEGQPLDLLGGEGLEIPQPATRQDFGDRN